MKKTIKFILLEIIPIIFIVISVYFEKRFEYAAENFMGYDMKLMVFQYISIILFGVSMGFIFMNKGNSKRECIVISAAHIIVAAVSAIYILLAFFMQKPTVLQFYYIEYMLNFGSVFIGINIFNGIRNIVLARYTAKENQIDKDLKDKNKGEQTETDEQNF